MSEARSITRKLGGHIYSLAESGSKMGYREQIMGILTEMRQTLTSIGMQLSAQARTPVPMQSYWQQEPVTFEDALGRESPVHIELIDSWHIDLILVVPYLLISDCRSRHCGAIQGFARIFESIVKGTYLARFHHKGRYFKLDAVASIFLAWPADSYDYGVQSRQWLW